ncbi:MAG TPA: hypothetical protein VF553_16495 [Pyrinomonadaceae bacterium]|jgi:hypothetical protein
MMTLQNKILPVALVAALLGGGVGAFVTRPSNPSTASTTTTAALPSTAATTADTATPLTGERAQADTASATGEDQEAFREGFAEGYRAAADRSGSTAARRSSAAPVVYRTASSRRARSVNSGNSRRVYYDYNTQPRQRSFWQKHRDKLTVAMGTGGGAILGGLIGGKKGAAIGALAGAGGSALYTYKLRNRSRRY